MNCSKSRIDIFRYRIDIESTPLIQRLFLNLVVS